MVSRGYLGAIRRDFEIVDRLLRVSIKLSDLLKAFSRVYMNLASLRANPEFTSALDKSKTSTIVLKSDATLSCQFAIQVMHFLAVGYCVNITVTHSHVEDLRSLDLGASCHLQALNLVNEAID